MIWLAIALTATIVGVVAIVTYQPPCDDPFDDQDHWGGI